MCFTLFILFSSYYVNNQAENKNNREREGGGEETDRQTETDTTLSQTFLILDNTSTNSGQLLSLFKELSMVLIPMPYINKILFPCISCAKGDNSLRLTLEQDLLFKKNNPMERL